jgi:uncharacterized 2Fe-2S/4Fe-4S cluster protein (DUF4445 family)
MKVSLITLNKIRLPLPSANDRRAHDQRIRDELGPGPLSIPLGVLKRLPSVVRHDTELSCIIGRTGSGRRLIDIGAERSYSIALDLGTTNLAALLYDNVAQQDVLTRSIENPQTAFGSDILTRMHHAMSRHAEELHRSLIAGINGLITSLCREAGVGKREVHALSMAGNTVMTHFVLGLDISTIPVDPFVPVVRAPGFFAASELSLDTNPEAVVYLFPNAGSYVGGDITAGILASGMFKSVRPSILIDVGTNAEVVIGNSEWMIVGAGAAGPALEEGISRAGKRAKKGIVYDVEIRDGNISCRTFDQGSPEGICGSGMVSLLHELYHAGMIDQSGTLISGEHVSEINGETAFSLDCDCGGDLFITQSEIQNFMKSKAAMFTLLLVLTRSVGIAFRDIENVFISGALGTGIDPAKAAGIGMVPAWPASIVRPLGNSSLAGARMLLADAGLVDTVQTIADRITYKHMHDDPEFMKEYLGAVFIPHTDPDLLKAG